MSIKQKRQPPQSKQPLEKSMAISAAVSILKGIRNGVADTSPSDGQGPVHGQTAAAIDAALTVLDALRDEIQTVEEARDLVHDYRIQAAQLQKLHFLVEVRDFPLRLGDQMLCPNCKRRFTKFVPAHCS